MVGGLIQQQYIIVLQQQFGQFYTHPPSARKGVGKFIEVFPLKTQSKKHLFCIAFVVVTAQYFISMGHIVKIHHKLMISIAFIIGTLGQSCVDFVQPKVHCLDLRKCLIGFFQNGPAFFKINILLKETDSYVFFSSYGSLVQRHFLCQEFEHGGFSGTVLSDKTYPIPSIETKRYFFEEIFSPKGYRKIMNI